jgi:hypothetical protein
MKLSNVSKRLFVLFVVTLFLVLALAPFAVVTADPGSDPIPVPGTTPPCMCSSGGGIYVTHTILDLVFGVVTAVVL